MRISTDRTLHSLKRMTRGGTLNSPEGQVYIMKLTGHHDATDHIIPFAGFEGFVNVPRYS